MSRFILSTFLMAIFAAAVMAQSVQVSSAEKLAIATLWGEIATAVQKKDRKALEGIYAADFIHVHAKGVIDDRKRRLDAILTGEPTIDTAAQVDFGFRKYGETIVAVGTVKVNDADGKSVAYAVTRVYVKEKGRWVFASSHASPVVGS